MPTSLIRLDPESDSRFLDWIVLGNNETAGAALVVLSGDVYLIKRRRRRIAKKDELHQNSMCLTNGFTNIEFKYWSVVASCVGKVLAIQYCLNIWSATAETGGRDVDDNVLVGPDIVGERIYFSHGSYLLRNRGLEPAQSDGVFEETRLHSVRTSDVILRLLCAVKSNGKPLRGRHHQVSSINEKDGKDISLSTCLDKNQCNGHDEANRELLIGR
jgi:hypothetical protein